MIQLFLRGRSGRERRWLPFARSLHRYDVDSVEQHRQLSGVERDGGRFVGHARQAKSPALETLVIEDEATPIPEEDLAAVGAAAQKNEEMATVEIELPLPVDDGRQPVVPPSHVHLTGR